MHKTVSGVRIARARRDRSQRFEQLEGRRFMAAHIVGNPNTYATIQAAVDAAVAGATITVDAGTYAEQVWVDKTLTIKGAQAGVDARSNKRVGAAESIVNGELLSDGKRTSGFYVGANNVTLDGFTVQGQTTQGDAGAGIVIAPSKNGTKIFNNIVQNNVSGLFLSNNSASNPAVIQYNLFKSNNNVGANGGRGIYTHAGISGGNLTNILIDNNAFINNRGSTGTTGLEAAIALEAFNAGAQSNITITNNVMDGNGKATLFFNTDNITIKNNYITNTLDKYSGILRFEGNIHNVLIQNNTIYNNTGPAVAVDSKGVPGRNSGFTITNNNFYFNSLGYGSRISVIFDGSVYDGSPDVRNNWWGDASGPGGDGAGTGDKVYGIGNPVPGQQWFFQTGGNERFSPWSTAINGSVRAPYFGLPMSDGATIQFEDFDHGGNGIGYNDTTASNSGGQYRKAERVDVETTTTDAGGGFNIKDIVAGEWLNYTINLAQGGVFNLDLRLATGQTAGGTFHVEVDGVNATGTLAVPVTGSGQTFTTLTKTGLNLTGGVHTLKFVFDSNGANGTVGNFNWFKLTNTSPVALPAAPSGLAASAASAVRVNLSWSDNATSETGFLLERRTGTTGAWTLLATLGADATTYADNAILSSSTYNYRVKALGAAGDSAFSNIASVTTPSSSQVTYLSDLPFLGTPINGWGPIERDQTVGGEGSNDGQTITLNGVTYAKGLGTHSVAEVSFNLGGAYKQFLADIGIDDKQAFDGTVVFRVFADNVKIFDSGVMTPTSATQKLNLDITGVQTLRLRVDDAGDGVDFDHADWADARLTNNSTPTPTVPSAPSGLAASAASMTQVNLTWSAVTGVTSYKIERAIGAGAFAQIGTSTGATFSDTTAVASTSYSYRVRATNAVGDSAYSSTAGATTPAAPTVPPAPSGLVGNPISPTRVDLSWSAASGAASYKIERAIGSGTFTQIGTSTGVSFNDTTASASTAYSYRVRANNAVGDGAYSNTATVTTPAAPAVPVAPAGLAASAASSTRVNLTWSASSGATSYKIERAIGTGAFTQIGTSTTTSFADTTATASTAYNYRVRANNAVGDSAYSNTATVTTPAAPTVPVAPVGLAASAASSTQVNLTWSAVSGATSYKIERATGSGTYTQIGTSATASFNDTTALASTAYSYRVRATNAVGDSAYSNVATVTTPGALSLWTTSSVGVMGPMPVLTTSNGTQTLKGAGSGIGGTSDSFSFSYQQLTGDGTIIARVASVQNTSSTAQAGIMMRDGMGANAKEVSIVANPSSARGVSFIRRSSVGGSSTTTTNNFVSTPVWLKLVRKGNTFTAYRSSNGTSWTQIGSQTISMNSTISVGLVVASKSTTTVNTSTFTNVSVTKP